MKVSFVVPGRPIGKARHRTLPLKKCRRCGANTVKRQCRCGSYEFEFLTNIESTPTNTRLYQNLVRMAAEEAMHGSPMLSGPLRLEATFYFQIPESRKKKLRENDPHTQRPDVSNCIKSVEDACNTVIYADDCLLAEITGRKRWSERARTEVEIESFPQG